MKRIGFTLIEVVVAIAITGLVAIMARRLVQVTIDSARLLSESRQRADQSGNAHGWLRATMLSLEAGDSAGSFSGYPDRMEFSAWVQQTGGWLVRRRIGIEANQGELVAHGLGRPLQLADSISSVEFDYLLEPGANTKWVHQWLSPVSAPLGVRIRMYRGTMADTLLLLIKERG